MGSVRVGPHLPPEVLHFHRSRRAMLPTTLGHHAPPLAGVSAKLLHDGMSNQSLAMPHWPHNQRFSDLRVPLFDHCGCNQPNWTKKRQTQPSQREWHATPLGRYQGLLPLPRLHAPPHVGVMTNRERLRLIRVHCMQQESWPGCGTHEQQKPNKLGCPPSAGYDDNRRSCSTDLSSNCWRTKVGGIQLAHQATALPYWQIADTPPHHNFRFHQSGQSGDLVDAFWHNSATIPNLRLAIMDVHVCMTGELLSGLQITVTSSRYANNFSPSASLRWMASKAGCSPNENSIGMRCATHSQPAFVERPYWNGRHLCSFGICFAMVLANRRTMSPTMIPLTPPSGLPKLSTVPNESHQSPAIANLEKRD